MKCALSFSDTATIKLLCLILRLASNFSLECVPGKIYEFLDSVMGEGWFKLHQLVKKIQKTKISCLENLLEKGVFGPKKLKTT